MKNQLGDPGVVVLGSGGEGRASLLVPPRPGRGRARREGRRHRQGRGEGRRRRRRRPRHDGPGGRQAIRRSSRGAEGRARGDRAGCWRADARPRPRLRQRPLRGRSAIPRARSPRRSSRSCARARARASPRAALAAEAGAERIVVGLPLSLSGADSAQTPRRGRSRSACSAPCRSRSSCMTSDSRPASPVRPGDRRPWTPARRGGVARRMVDGLRTSADRRDDGLTPPLRRPNEHAHQQWRRRGSRLGGRERT